jgi:hypothetical protein
MSPRALAVPIAVDAAATVVHATNSPAAKYILENIVASDGEFGMGLAVQFLYPEPRTDGK